MVLDSRLNLDQWADQWWRLCNLYYIVTDDGVRVKFYPNDAQERLYENLWYLNDILKARQQGFTTFIDLLGLDLALFKDNQTVGITADSRENATKIFRNKIKYPYDNLPLGVRRACKSETMSELLFDNDSSVSVGVSLRSGTLQFLHVSEYGKISAKYPDKAKEIKTGSFNAVKAGQFIFVESTAEGRGGEFYNLTEQARKTDALVKAGKTELTTMDFRFHFFAWFESPKYTLPDKVAGKVIIPADSAEYFEKLELMVPGLKLTRGQKAWYVKKAELMGDDMKKEFPSTADEAFEVAIEGAYFGKEMLQARAQGRICRIPVLPNIPVNTFWDLGVNDVNAIWFHQRVGMENRFIDYYQNTGKGLAHYWKILQERREAGGYVFGRHYLPHDVEVSMLTDKEYAETRLEIMEKMGMAGIEVVPRIADKNDGIELVRGILPACFFDIERTDDGIKGLEAYQHEWDEKQATWKAKPLHNWASNPTDAFMGFAQGYKPGRGTSSRPNGSRDNHRTV